MFDPLLRRLLGPGLDRAGRGLARRRIGADALTVAGFAVGMAAVLALALGWYGAALAMLVLNRLADGLDGAVARAAGGSDFGGYLDIVCDFLVYAAVPFGFALSRPEDGVAALFLMLSFVGTGTTFLAFAILAAKRGLATTRRGAKVFYYLGGLTEGSETFACFAAMCMLPDAFAVLAYVFGGLCWLTTAGRVYEAWKTFGRG